MEEVTKRTFIPVLCLEDCDQYILTVNAAYKRHYESFSRRLLIRKGGDVHELDRLVKDVVYDLWYRHLYNDRYLGAIDSDRNIMKTNYTKMLQPGLELHIRNVYHGVEGDIYVMRVSYLCGIGSVELKRLSPKSGPIAYMFSEGCYVSMGSGGTVYGRYNLSCMSEELKKCHDKRVANFLMRNSSKGKVIKSLSDLP